MRVGALPKKLRDLPFFSPQEKNRAKSSSRLSTWKASFFLPEIIGEFRPIFSSPLLFEKGDKKSLPRFSLLRGETVLRFEGRKGHSHIKKKFCANRTECTCTREFF